MRAHLKTILTIEFRRDRSAGSSTTFERQSQLPPVWRQSTWSLMPVTDSVVQLGTGPHQKNGFKETKMINASDAKGQGFGGATPTIMPPAPPRPSESVLFAAGDTAPAIKTS
mmetsp:Transcript_118870/g.341401  ORF Transcript_118870/g.341401 Transcript_118870/m.341401 type:complete len:112 (-) Transcript_118870:824-1159(-)